MVLNTVNGIGVMQGNTILCSFVLQADKKGFGSLCRVMKFLLMLPTALSCIHRWKAQKSTITHSCIELTHLTLPFCLP
jgi:hypothetical protein